MLKKALLGFFALILCSTLASSQPLSLAPSDNAYSPCSYSVEDAISLMESWTIYQDSEKKVLYIDFESFNVNLSSIKVYDHSKGMVFSDDLWDVPVNAIYELNVKNYKPGTYRVELNTYTSLLQKDVRIPE